MAKADIDGVITSLVGLEKLYTSFDRIFAGMEVGTATRLDYQARCTEFYLFVTNRGLHVDSLLEYKRFLDSDKRYSVSTKNKKLTAARIFLRELYKRGALPRDITIGVKNFRQSELHKLDGLNDADIKKIRLWMHSDRPQQKHDVRTFAILMLLAYHGLRQAEICRLNYKDLSLREGYALVRGKGRDDKERVHLHPAVVMMLKDYCQQYQITQGPMFFSVSNSSYGMRLTPRSLRRIVKRVFDRLDIDRTVHGFRHWYTTRLITAYRGDLFRVKQFTRHKTLDMLQVYNDELTHARQYPVHDRLFNGML